MRRVASQPKTAVALTNGHSNRPHETAKPEPLAMRLQDAAELLGVSDRTLWTWTKKGIVPHVRIGGTVIYPYHALKEWLREQSAMPVSKRAADSAEGAGESDAPAP
jgi:excisionase family DNA binding protein